MTIKKDNLKAVEVYTEFNIYNLLINGIHAFCGLRICVFALSDVFCTTGSLVYRSKLCCTTALNITVETHTHAGIAIKCKAFHL